MSKMDIHLQTPWVLNSLIMVYFVKCIGTLNDFMIKEVTEQTYLQYMYLWYVIL